MAGMTAVPVLKTKATQSPRSCLPPEARKWAKQVSQLIKIFKANSTERNREKLCQQETKKAALLSEETTVGYKVQ